jgi:hypothetical protein
MKRNAAVGLFTKPSIVAREMLSVYLKNWFPHSKGRCIGGGDRPQKNLLLAILVISLALFPGACAKEEEPKLVKPRVAVPIKRASVKRPFTPVAQEEAVKRASLSTKTAAPEKTDLRPRTKGERPENQLVVEGAAGYYRSQKGDTLFKIAGRKDVYGNPMKWPSLFRLNIDRLGRIKVAKNFQLKWSSVFQLNMDKLGGMKVVEDFQHEELPEGHVLRFFTPDEVQKNLAETIEKEWVVSVLSSQTPKKLVPPAITLMKNGYRVYIARATVKGKEWMRLRVGFFEDRGDAAAAGKKIMSTLNADDIWVARIGKEELGEFAGY